MKTAFALCTVIVIAAFAFASPCRRQIGQDVIGRYGRRVDSGWYASCHEPPIPSPLLSPVRYWLLHVPSKSTLASIGNSNALGNVYLSPARP